MSYILFRLYALKIQPASAYTQYKLNLILISLSLSRMVVSPLKGQCHEIFCSGFFRESFPQASDNSIRVISNFFGIGAPPVSITPAANFPPMSTTLVANNGNTFRLLTPESEL